MIGSHITGRDVAAAEALAEPVGELEVWPGCRHAVTRAEREVLGSAPFQRLRRLRQMGLAYFAWPNADNTRASHSLGVAYWSARYLDALRRNGDVATQAALADAADSLDGLSLDLVVRLFGLLHDIDLLPLGHALRYQCGLFREPPGRPRLAACVAAIKDNAEQQECGEASEAGRRVWLDVFNRHLDAAAAPADLPHARVAAELVNSGFGADLLDFALRDSFAINRAQRLHDDLPEGLRLVETERGWGLAVDISDPVTAGRRVTIADDLYRARFEVFAASVFHPVKLAADAMLDLALRRLGAETCRVLLPEDRLITMGDDEFLDVVASAEQAIAARHGWDPIGAALKAGRLYDEVWRTEDLGAFRRRLDAERALALDPTWRSEVEEALRDALGWAAPGDLIVGVSPPTVQAKPADARFVGADGGVFSLAEASARGFATQAGDTARRHEHLWSLRVYLTPRWRSRSAEAAKAATIAFGRGA